MTTESIRVRMYQAGFGDCFLLFLPTSAGTRTMLVDCGSLGGGRPKFAKVVERLLADVGGHVDVIVATHRHADHISGFENDGWKGVTASEVWMPWTERPDDPVAARIRLAQEDLARALSDSLPVGADAGAAFLAANALTNEKARDRLLQLGTAAGATPRWIACEAPGLNPVECPVLPGVDVFVLGPLHDEKTFADMQPPPAQNFAHQTGSAAAKPDGVPPTTDTRADGAFPPSWQVPAAILTEQEIAQIRNSIPDMRLELLAINDNLINSTSIVLVLRVGEKYLLLPGDAQWSTWRAALADPARRDLLRRTTFFKVGHHGSENATPVEFPSELLKGRSDVVSMVSWVKRANWKRIPEEHLIESLREIGPLADHLSNPLPPAFTADPDGLFIEAIL
jgi:beta-lactamase superfamily II metal-dependent hydrolase